MLIRTEESDFSTSYKRLGPFAKTHNQFRVMIAQGAWRRMFNGIKAREDLSALLNQIFLEHDPDKKAEAIDRLYKLNERKHINNLTGPSGNAVCAMLAAFDPVHN